MAERPDWLPPGWVALTERDGSPLFLQAGQVAGVTGAEGQPAAVFVSGLQGCALVQESAYEVTTAVTRATA